MNKETLNNIFAFLQRVDLKGHEVPAFNKAINELSQLAENEESSDKEE